MEKKVLIQVEGVEAKELLRTIKKGNLFDEPGLSFNVQTSEDYFRSGFEEPAVLVALVTGGAAALTALLAGLLRIAEKRFKESGRITLRGSSGRSVEIPVNASDARIEALIEHAKALDQPSIVITK